MQNLKEIIIDSETYIIREPAIGDVITVLSMDEVLDAKSAEMKLLIIPILYIRQLVKSPQLTVDEFLMLPIRVFREISNLVWNEFGEKIEIKIDDFGGYV